MNATRILLCATLFSLASAAHAATAVYDVDPAYRQEVMDILREMLTTDHPDMRGTVQLLPTGQIVVDTLADERQTDVAMLLESIASAEPEETPTVTLRYWVLQGTAGGVDSGSLPRVLEDVISELELVHGDLGFSVTESAMVTGRAGRETTFESITLEIEQTAHVNGNQLNASIVFESITEELEVDVSLERGEFVVLSSGSSGESVTSVIVNWPGDD